jgi:hypothetical protein
MLTDDTPVEESAAVPEMVAVVPATVACVIVPVVETVEVGSTVSRVNATDAL